MDEIVYEGYDVEFQYRPGQWTTQASCMSTYEQAMKTSVLNDPDFRIVKVVKYLVRAK